MRLEDDVGLSGDKEAGVFRVGKRRRCFVIRLCGRTGSIWERCLRLSAQVFQTERKEQDKEDACNEALPQEGSSHERFNLQP